MTLVNVLVIGAGRSGTTSISAYLAAHPEVSSSITKEVHYFSIADLYKRGESYFHSLFPDETKKITTTADTYLLMDHSAPEKVFAYNPNMKIIIMLRDPISRSYSNYNYSVNFGHEKKENSFLSTIDLEKERLNTLDIVDVNNTCHLYGSLYHKHISIWNKYFDVSQLVILKLNDLKNNPESFYRNLCSRLDINYFPFDEANKEFNAASGAKSIWLQQFLLNRNNPIRKTISFILRPFRNLVIKSGIIDKVYAMNKKQVVIQPLSPHEKEIATQYFKEDLAQLKKDYGISFEN